MWKYPLNVALLGVLAVELFFLGSDLLRFYDRIGMREVIIVLLVVGTVIVTREIGRGARRL